MRRVKAAAAVIRDEAGQLRYYYRGSVLPGGLNEDEVQRCIDRGLVEEVKAKELATVPLPDLGPDGGIGDSPGVVTTSDGVEHVGVLPANAATDEPGDQGPKRPAKTAKKELWVEYAIASGADEAWARDESTTTRDLIDRYGGE